MEKLLTSLGVEFQDEKILQNEIVMKRILSLITFPSRSTSTGDNFSNSHPITGTMPTPSTSSISTNHANDRRRLQFPQIMDMGCLPILSTTSSLLLFNEIKNKLKNKMDPEYEKNYLKYLFYKKIYQQQMQQQEQLDKIEDMEDIGTNEQPLPCPNISITNDVEYYENKKRTTQTKCPICNENIVILPDQSIDYAVSNHIDFYCKENSNKRKRLSRSSTTSPQSKSTPDRVTRSSRRTRRNSPITPSSSSPENAELEFSDSPFVDETPDEENDSELVKLRNNNMKLNPINTSKVVDDWEEDQFQTRVLEYELNLTPSSNDEEANNTEPLSDSHNDQVRYRDLQRRVKPGECITSHGSIVEESTWSNLYEYQKEGVKWMWGLYMSGGGTGGILGDEMGLGKTVQLCTHYYSIANEEYFRQISTSGKTRKPLLLVVCPATVQHHWLQEFHRWAPRLRVVILHSISPTFAALNTMGQAAIKRAINKISQEDDDTSFYGVVLIVSYEGLRSLQKILLNIRWLAVTLDEGQKIKNPDANITLVCKDLPTFHRLILSGTPIQNSLKELWSLFDFVFPGRLGTLAAFESEFATPIKLGGYNNATKLQVEIAIKSATILQGMIKPYLLRRKKDAISNLIKLPNKIEQVLFCVLSPNQRSIYQEIISSPELQNAIRMKKPLFSILMTLRKLCNHPILAYQVGQIKWHDSDQVDESTDITNSIDRNLIKWSDSGKLLVLSHILPLWKHEQHKILIFCQMYSMISLVEIMLNELSLKYMRLDGKTPVSKRQNIINHFNSSDSDIPILLLTTRTGGVGISLTAANRVILVDPDWNPQIDIQARERAWRIGQKREVIIYRLITRGTLEEKIYHRQIFKLLLTNRILENPKQKRFFSKHDIQELFELDNFDNSLPVDINLELPMDQPKRPNKINNVEVEEGEIHEELFNPQHLTTIDSTIATLTKLEQNLTSTSNPSPLPEQTNEDNSNDRDHQLLRALYDGDAIAAVYDHTYFENSTNKGSTRSQDDQIKRLAKQVVDEAVKQLRNSNTIYTENSSSRDRLGLIDNRSSSQRGGRFSSSNSQRATSSSSLLSGLRQLQGRQSTSTIENSSSLPLPSSLSNSTPVPEDHMTSSVLFRLQKIFQQRSSQDGYTTDEILNYFTDLPDQFAPIFREMLRRIAIFNDGKWKLISS